jgi:hypothetical protein
MQKLLVGIAGTITTYPRVSNGHDSNIVSLYPATSITALNKSPTNADAQDTYARVVTPDTLSTTTQGATQLGSNSIVLAGNVALVEGRQYVIVDAHHGTRFTVVASKGGTTNTLWVQEPIPYDIQNGSQVLGLAISIAIPATQTDSAGNGVVYVRGTVNGVIKEWAETYRVVYRVTTIALTPTMLSQDYPIIRQIASNTDFSLEEAIQASWRNLVVPVLSARGVLDEEVLTDDVIVPFHEIATVLHFARNWPSAPSDWLENLEANYEKIKQTMFDRIDFLVVSAKEETPISPVEATITRRQLKAVR